MNKIISILFLLCSVAGLYGQGRTITGRVTDEVDASPLIGASILAKTDPGTSQIGTIADLDGNFTLELPAGINTIVVSYVGYETREFSVEGLSTINVTLGMSSTALDEVVITALGIKKEKKALGYSFSEVDGDELTTNRDVNFINSISNKVAGVNISQTAGGAGTSSRIIIRGVKSLSTESQPLIVVDGVPIDNSVNDVSWYGGLDYGNSMVGISPDDIETMSVLKGPNAAALYGSRAATGVILITTKKGSAGEQLSVTLNSNFMFDRAYIVAQYQNEYGLGFGGNITKQALSPEQVEIYGVDSARYSYGTGSWGPKMDGTWEVLNWNGKFTTVTPQPDNAKDYYEHGYTLTNTVGISNGSEKFNWRLALASLNNKGLKPNSTYDRYNVSFNMNSKLNKYASVNFKGSYLREDAFNRVGMSDSRTGSRNFVWMPRSVNINTLREDYKNDNGLEQNWRFTDDWMTNPYWEAFENYNNDTKDQFIGFVKLDLNLTPWLKGFVRTSMDTYGTKRYNRVGNGALRENGEGSYTEQWVNYRSMSHDFLLTADKNIGENFNLTGNLGGNYYRSDVDYQSTTIIGLAVPNFFSLNNPKYPDQTSAGSSKSTKVIQSLYGSAQLQYKNWIYLELTGRNDWTSTLPVDNNSYFYPSINTSFVFSEAFGMGKNFLSFGKIRGSYAFVGNDTGPHKLSWRFINQAYGAVPAVYLQGVGFNPDLKPERTGSWEVGTDLRFWMNRLSLDLTYYNEITYDQIVQAEISPSSGVASILTNGGEISNKGIELMLDISPVRTSDFNWDISLNFARNRNEVLSLAEELERLPITGESQINILAVPGLPYGEITGARFMRYYKTDSITGQVLDDPNNGRPLVGDDGFFVMDSIWGPIGNITPDWSGGITNNLRFKGLSLTFTIGFQRGGDIFSKTNKYGMDMGQFVETLEGRDSWYASSTQEQLVGRMGQRDANGDPILDVNGDQVFDPQSDPVGIVAEGVLADGSENIRGVDPQFYQHQRKWGGIAELDIYDASYVKLRDLTINYDFPASWFNNKVIKSASLAFVGRNLWLIYSGVPNVDPESAFSSNNNGIGQEYASMPSTRSYGFNLKLVF